MIETKGRAPDLVLALVLFWAMFALSFLGYTRSLSNAADEMLYFSLTQSMAKWHTITLDQVSTVGPAPEEFGLGGHRYTKKAPLASVLGVPLFWLAQSPLGRGIGAVDMVLLLNEILVAATAAVLFLLVRRMGYPPWVALILGVVATLATPLWVYGKLFFAEPTITLTFIVTLYAAYAAATTRRAGWVVATGVAYGLAVAAKYIDLALLAPVPVYLAWTFAASAGQGEKRGHTSASMIYSAVTTLLWFSLGAIPVGELLVGYDLARYGLPLDSGYGAWETFSTPTLVGVAGLLFSPGKSIFVYTPVFLLTLWWGPAFFRRFPTWSGMVGAIIVLNLVLYGSWYVWWGAWGWGSRFTVPIMPLVALFLAEGLVAAHGWGVKIVAGVLGLLSVGVQILGVAVHYDVYLNALMRINSRPDTLTLYDIRRSPILQQIYLLTRQKLDLAWILPNGPQAIDWPALTTALLGAGIACACLVLSWRARSWKYWLPVLLVSSVVVPGAIYADLRQYDQAPDQSVRAVVNTLANAPANATILQMAPSVAVPFANWQKRDLPELGWSEEPYPSPRIDIRLARLERRSPEVWVVTEAPAKAPMNGVEASLDRGLVELSETPLGRFRVLRFAVQPTQLHFAPVAVHFAQGIDLTGFLVSNGPPAPNQTFDVTLRWQASPDRRQRPDFTVFVHFLDDTGKLVGQQDDPPASGYLPTSQWRPNQVVYDEHTIVVSANAATNAHLLQVGLYLPSTGVRVAVLSANVPTTSNAAVLNLQNGRH